MPKFFPNHEQDFISGFKRKYHELFDLMAKISDLDANNPDQKSLAQAYLTELDTRLPELVSKMQQLQEDVLVGQNMMFHCKNPRAIKSAIAEKAQEYCLSNATQESLFAQYKDQDLSELLPYLNKFDNEAGIMIYGLLQQTLLLREKLEIMLDLPHEVKKYKSNFAVMYECRQSR